ncbi:hypothetical protein ACP70R_018380 [Stipagrostis hirtigluma subsp. patula]
MPSLHKRQRHGANAGAVADDAVVAAPGTEGILAGVGMENAQQESEERDWAQLLPELVNKVADGLLLVDPTEYIRLRAVCKPWRRCTADPSLIETRFFPRNWLLLAERKLRQDGEPEHFVNVRTGASLRIHLPWPDEFTHHGNAEGLLVLYHEITDMVCLLNPLTMAITDLPSMAAVNAAARSLNLNTTFSENCIKAAGVIMVAGEAGRPRPNPTIVLSLTLLKQTLLVCAKPGEFSWTAINMSCTREVEGRLPMIEGGLSARGHFYIPTRAGDVLTVELQPQPHLRFVARQGGNLIRSGLNHSSYIVPSGDDKGSGMLLVRTRWRKHQLYSMDSTVELDNSRLIRHTMSGITVFLPSITLNSSQFPLVSQNDVYTEVSTRRLLQGEYI